MSRRIAIVAEGDANTPDCWSGSGQRIVEALREAGAVVDVFNSELKSWRRGVVLARTFHPTRAVWRQKYGLSGVAFRARSAQVNRLLNESGAPYDAIVQIGATFGVNRSRRTGARYILYCDGNIEYARRGAPYSAASRLPPSALAQVVKQERGVYDAVDAIWTMSDALARSFIADFDQAPSKLRTIYAGVNNPPAFTPRDDATNTMRRVPKILFVGKDHTRKGSAILLGAFDRVRQSVPEAELHLVGGIPRDANRPGVFAHGVVTRSTPEGRATLDELWSTASVFCMPSRYEPFGIAFAEAMLAGLPCIGTTKWAMPEIVVDGETGWLVPDGSVDDLTRVLIAALANPEACARMGAKGRERSLALFTWKQVAARALGDLERLIGGGQ